MSNRDWRTAPGIIWHDSAADLIMHQEHARTQTADIVRVLVGLCAFLAGLPLSAQSDWGYALILCGIVFMLGAARP